MSATDVGHVINQVENSPTRGDGHTHDFNNVYQSIVQMQQHDGGSNSAQFHQDMNSVNTQLKANGLLTNMEIVGVDDHHNLITRDVADHQTVVQDASSVNDFGALGSGHSAEEQRLGLLAGAFGINVTRNGDGSYDVQNPLDDPQAVGNILSTVLKGLTGADAGSDGGQARPPLGMNGWMWQAWNSSPQPAEAQADPPDDQ